MNDRIKLIFPAVFILLLMNLASAYSWGYYSSSPMDFLESEWVRFALVFALFFAIVFFAVHKSMKENVGAAAVIAIVVSAFISMAVAQRGWLYSYAGEGIGNLALIFALLIGAGLIIKLMNDVFGRFGGIIAVIILWIVLQVTDISYFYFFEEAGDYLYGILEYVSFPVGGEKAILGLIILVIAVALLWKFGKRKVSGYELLGKRY